MTAPQESHVAPPSAQRSAGSEAVALQRRAEPRRAPLAALAWVVLCAASLWAAFCGAELLSRTDTSVSARWVSAQTGAQPLTAQQVNTALERLRENWGKSTGQAQQAAGAQAAVPANGQPVSQTGTAPAQTPTAAPQSAGVSQSGTSAAEVPPSLAFWRETQADILSANRSAKAAVVTVLGDASLCYPAQMICGALPASGDSFGCAVSEQLAWLLWGSTDVVGLPLHIGDSGTQAYSVRGVFRGTQALLLCAESDVSSAQDKGPVSSERTSGAPQTDADEGEAPQGFTSLEIRGLPSGDRRTALSALLQAANLPEPLQISWTGTRASLARALCFAPFLAAAFAALACVSRLLWRRFSRFHGLLLFTAALGAALLLPFLFAQVPAWLIPARWSDLAFWSGLWRTLVQEIENALALVPFSPDLPARRALLQTAGGSALALLCAVRLRATRRLRPRKA